MPWKAVFSSRLEPRHQSLLWLVQHGAVMTGRQLVHIRPEATHRCPYCGADYETLRHYFYECPRVYEFWQLVGGFLDRIQVPTASAAVSTPVELKDVLAGLPAWKNSIPSLIVWYALAMWQIYRAHAECAIDGVRTEARGLFIRWQEEVMRRICIDLRIAKRTNQVDRFRKHWLAKPCQWFVFDDGGGVLGRSKVVFNAALTAPTPATEVEHE